MANCIDMLGQAVLRPTLAQRAVLALFLLAAATCAPAAPPASPASPYQYVPRAHFVDVQRAYVSPGDAPMPGAAIRAFQNPEADAGGSERFEIRWFANSPGIPPGVVLLLESIQERNPVVKNHVLSFNTKSEGHIRSVIEIPPEQIRQAGRILKWRVRLVWRGRLLASQASANWDG